MRHFKTLLISTVISITSLQTTIAQEARPQDRQLTAKQIETDINIAKDTYERIHPGYTRYTSKAELDDAWNEILLEAQTQNGLTLGEFYISVQDVLADIRCDHTKAELPRSISKDRDITPVYLPFIWQVVQGRALISNPGISGLSRGDEIKTIDGRPITEMMEEVRPLIPFDGRTHFVTDSHMAASLEFMGGAVDHFGSLLWDIQPTARLELTSANGESKTVSLDRILFKEWKDLVLDGKASTDFPDSITFNRIGDKAAYLRVDSFVNYRNPVKPKDVYGPIFSSIKDEGRDTLILDLRENGGGSTDAKVGLFAHLIKKKDRLVRDTQIKTLDHSGLEEHISTWEKRLINPNKLGFKKNKDGSYSLRKLFNEELKTVKPATPAFDGKLIVLTSQSNGSATTALLAKLKDMGRATLIGEETGGSAEGTTAGVLFYLNMPESKIRVRVPVLRDFNDVETFVQGKGVTPDIITPFSVEDFRAGQDPAYTAALSLIADK